MLAGFYQAKLCPDKLSQVTFHGADIDITFVVRVRKWVKTVDYEGGDVINQRTDILFNPDFPLADLAGNAPMWSNGNH